MAVTLETSTRASIERSIDLLIDYLAVARRGSAAPSSEAARRAIGVETAGPSVVEGSGGFARAEDAALLNGIAAHGIELDDTYEPGSLHPGVAVWPAVLALADELRLPADAALAAAVRGYDVACDLGDRLGAARAYARGFHPTGVCGVVAAAAACAELLDLDDEGARHAMGVAASMASGLLAFLDDGAWTKRLHAGRAAEGGVRAARLAAAGFVGPADAFSGEHGFLHAFGGDEVLDVPPLGPGAGILRTGVKLHPACRYTHGCIDLLLDLAPDPEQVEEVQCAVLRGGWTLVADPIERKRRVRSSVDAQFSMPFTAALAIARGAVRLDDVERAAELGPELESLTQRISCVEDAELEAAYPGSWGAAVTVRHRDGKVEQRRSADPLGSPARPVDREGIVAKAAGLLGEAWAAEADRVAAALPAEEPLADALAPLRSVL
jgi:2-methylcitrate dehydratase PrpD